MKVLIAGSRTFNDMEQLRDKMNSVEEIYEQKITAVLCGMAKGADLLGRLWALERGISVLEYPANWATEGRSAGYIRNVKMVDNADLVIAFWDGESKGTKHTIDTANRKGVSCEVIRFRKE